MCRMRQGPTNMKTIPLIWIGQAFRQRLGGKRKGKKYLLASVWISSQRVGDQNKEGNLRKMIQNHNHPLLHHCADDGITHRY